MMMVLFLPADLLVSDVQFYVRLDSRLLEDFLVLVDDVFVAG